MKLGMFEHDCSEKTPSVLKSALRFKAVPLRKDSGTGHQGSTPSADPDSTSSTHGHPEPHAPPGRPWLLRA